MKHLCRSMAFAMLTVAMGGCGSEQQTPPPTLESAMGELSRFRFAEARTALERVRADAAAGSDTWRRATYALGVAYHQEPAAAPEMTAAAMALYEELWKSCAGTPEAAQAAMQLGRIAQLRDFYKDAVDLPAARTWYGKAIAAAGDHLVGSQATIYLAGAWIEELKPESFAQADRVLTERLQAKPDDPLASLMWMTLADLRHVYLRDPRGAVVALRHVDRIGSPAALRWKVVWRMGAIAQDELGDRELAIACFQAIATRYLRSGRADEARDRLRELGVEPPPLPENLWDVQGDPPAIELASESGKAP